MSAVAAAARPLDLSVILVELSDCGPPSELRRQAPRLAAAALELDRVLLSSVRSGELVAEALHDARGEDAARITLARLEQHRVALEYPLFEGEIMRRRRPELVHAAPGQARARHAFADELQWGDCLVAPVVLDNRVIGFLHGDRAAGRELSLGEARALGAFALMFALVYERAVLRMRLRLQRQEMRQVAAWADARAGDLEDRLVSLEGDGEHPLGAPARAAPAEGARAGLRDLLTRREIEVLELMVRGDTNAAIARDLVLSTGTVKFHVKNILRKLHAANRAEAASRYLRLTLKS